MKMVLTGKNKYKMIYARSNANGAAFINAKNTRRILALGSKQLLHDTKHMFVLKRVSGNLSIRFQKKVMRIQSSAMHFSRTEIALRFISLKRKTNKQNPDTVLKTRV